MSDLLHDCERAVAVAARRGAQSAEAFALEENGGQVEIEKGSLASAEWESSRGLGLRVFHDGRIGFAFATSLARIPEAVDAALKAARIGKRLPRFSFAPDGPVPRVAGLHDPRVASLGAEALLTMGADLLDAVTATRKDLVAAGGSVHAAESACAIANSEGLARSHTETGLAAHVYVVQNRDGVSTGNASSERVRLDLDAARVGREAAELAVASARPTPYEKPGARPCIVRPEAASDLLSTVTVEALGGRAAHRGESFYTGKLGRRVMHPRLSLIDDPTLAAGLGSTPFDDEGTATRPRRLVDRGILKTYVFDRADAAEWKATTTGHAVRSHAFDGRSYKSPPSANALQLRLEAPKTTTPKLIASIDDGLLLHDLMGVHTANTVSGDFSVTSSLLFRIRKGAIEGPVAPLSVSGNVHRALRTGLRLGDDEKAFGGSPAWRLPSVLFDDFSVTP